MKRILFVFCLVFTLASVSQFSSSAADPRDVTVTVQVSDNLSGAYMIQIAEDKLNPPAAIPYASSVVVRTAADILYVRVQDRALNWSEWVTSIVGNVPVIQNPSPTPTPTPSPTASATPTVAPPAAGGGGGGGGGGAPKQTALYFQVVDPSDATKIYTKSVCVEIYSRTLTPQFMGTGCSGADGRINVLVGDAKVSIRVFELGNGAVYKEYTGEVASDVFTLDGGVFFAGTTRYIVSISGSKNNTSTPTPTPSPTASATPSPTPIATSTPSPTPTAVPTVTPTPVATPSPTPTAIPTLSPTPSASPVATKSSYFATTTSSSNLSKVTLKSTSAITSTKVGKSLQISIPTVGTKSVSVKVLLIDPSGNTFTVASSTVSKNKAYVTPNVKFIKPGTYVMTITLGTTKKVVTVKVS